MEGVAYSPNPDGPWYPVRKDTGIFHNIGHHHHPKWSSDSDAVHHCHIEKYHVPCIHDHCHEGFIEHPTTMNA